jgi:hypothetical protein
VCPRTPAAGARAGNVLPIRSVFSEPEKLPVEDNRASVRHHIASQSRDSASVHAAANGFIPLLIVAKLEFDGRARP